jgi:hypothetical protein
MRSTPVSLFFLLVLSQAAVPGTARAACPGSPPECLGGGGPAATDCFVQFSGVASTKVTCTDGDASCDTDGVRKGSCTFALSACIGQSSASCTAAPLDGPVTVTPATPVATALQTAIAALDPVAGGCTAPGVVVPLQVSIAGIKPGKAKLTVQASAGGKKDRDKVKLTCVPSPTVPTLSNDVQPIMTARCAVPQCHSGPVPSEGQSLEAGQTYTTDVNVRATEAPKLFRVKPGNPKASFLVRKILGTGIPVGGGAEMPQGCPGAPPPTGCLSDADRYTIIAWIKGGAPNN